MAIKILETFKKGKVNERLCEDAFFQSENYIAVIDGVTSKTDFLYHGKTTGKLASEIIYRVLETLRGDEPLRLLHFMTRLISRTTEERRGSRQPA